MEKKKKDDFTWFFWLLVSSYIHRVRKPTEGGVCYQVKASLIIYVDSVSQVKIDTNRIF